LKILTNSFIHVVYLFVALGNAELINKMASYTTNRKLFVIKAFYFSGGSCVAVERQYRREFSVRVVPSTLSTGLLNSLNEQESV
jgi:hypothetical protein